MENKIIGYAKCDIDQGEYVQVLLIPSLYSEKIDFVITPFELECIRLELKLKSGYQPDTNDLDDNDPPQETSC